MIQLRPDQLAAVNDLRRAMVDHQSVLLHAECGWGKCLGLGTPVLMYDGTVKLVQDVAVGDLLIGPDSLPRTVLSLVGGRENLWRVHQRKGEDYTVNESHILSLMMPRRGGAREIINMSISEYLEQGFGVLNRAKGWKSSANFSPGDELLLDPYILGVWLGDGTSRTFSITTGDKEIKSSILEFARTGGLRIRVEPNSPRSEVIHVVADRGKNWAMKALRDYDLILNKHVPMDYKRACCEDRLALLAGFLDADGHCNPNGGFDVSQKSEKLIDGIIFIARSLGFAAHKKVRNKTCGNNGKVGSYFHFALNGPLDTIPCRIPRKRGSARRQVKNHLVTGIGLEPMGEGDYYGFEIDGDRLFLLGDFTVTHNTVASAYMASGAHAKRKRVIFGVHRRELARQTAKTFDRFGIRYGFIAAGMRSDPFALVQIASHGTLMNRPDLLKCDLFVPDEAHLWATGRREEMIQLVRLHGAHIVPLTATPERGSGVGLANIADYIVHGPNVAWLIERGHLARYKAFAPVAPDMSGLHTRGGDYITSELEDRFSKPTVIGDRVASYRKYALGKRMIGYCYSRKNGEETAATFRHAGISAEFLDGETPDDKRCNVIGAFADGRVDVLVNCQLFREGFDLSAQVGRTVPIQAAAFWCPTQSLPLAVQMMMRPLRPQEGHAILLDHVNLLATHGLPDDEREWTLEGVPKKSREAAIMTMRCPSCFGTVRPARVCPECGHVMATDADGNMRLGGRVVKEVAGEIVEVDVEQLRRARKLEINSARSLDALVELARARGYRAGWIVNTMKARGDKAPTFFEVERAMRG